jgi:hypothetical protein
MKPSAHITLALGLLVFAGTPAAFAAKGGKGKATEPSPPSAVYQKYDNSGNGLLGDEEKDTLRKDYKKDKAGALKVWDTDSDGKLSDAEIAAIPATMDGKPPIDANWPARKKGNQKNKPKK